MKKIIVSIITIGLLLTTSIASVNAFDTGELEMEISEIFYAIHSADIYVDDDNTEGPWNGTREHPYQFIQDGVDAAEEGDVVFVFNGIYEDDFVDIDTSLVLVGENRDATIIKGSIWITKNDNVTICKFTITKHPNDDSAHYVGIIIRDSDNIKIQNNAILNSSARHIRGIDAVCSDHITIKKNIIKNLKSKSYFSYGIRLSSSNYDIIVDNEIEKITGKQISGIGIEMTFSSHSNKISRNILKNNENTGVFLDSLEDWYSCDNIISENLIVGSKYGIYLSSTNHLIYSDFNNTFSNNYITNNYWGIYIGKYVNNNTVTENCITNNNLYGIEVKEKATNNHFYYNNFENNGGIIIIGGNAIDKGSNTWDDGSEMGNYWDDYIGWDLNPRDGIGDIPYNIPGGDNKDNYPLMGPYPNAQGTSYPNQQSSQQHSSPSSSPTRN